MIEAYHIKTMVVGDKPHTSDEIAKSKLEAAYSIHEKLQALLKEAGDSGYSVGELSDNPNVIEFFSSPNPKNIKGALMAWNGFCVKHGFNKTLSVYPMPEGNTTIIPPGRGGDSEGFRKCRDGG